MQVFPDPGVHQHGGFFKRKDPTIVSTTGSTQYLTPDQVSLCEHNQAPSAAVAQLYDLGKSIRDSVVGSGQQLEGLHDQSCNRSNATPGKVILDNYQGCSGEADYDPATQALNSLNLERQSGTGTTDWIMAPAEDGGQNVGTLYRTHAANPQVAAEWHDLTQELVVAPNGGWRVTNQDIDHGYEMWSP